MPADADSIRKPYIDLPGLAGNSDLRDLVASIPKEQQHRFESAGEFIRRLADRIQKWRETLPDDMQPVILALLPSGGAIEVHTIGEDGHSSVVVEGTLDDQTCMFVSHQASFQILCYTQKVEEPAQRRFIGFHVGGEKLEA